MNENLLCRKTGYVGYDRFVRRRQQNMHGWRAYKIYNFNLFPTICTIKKRRL